MWKDFFYFTQREKQGILILAILIAGIFIVKRFFFQSEKNTVQTPIEEKGQEPTADVFDKESSRGPETRTYYYPKRQKQYQPYRNQSTTPEKRTYYQPQRDTSVAIHPKVEKFSQGTMVHLNSTDTIELVKIPGIGQSYASRILKYRQLLGGYYSTEQLKEVYGMYEELYEKITPFFNVSTDSIRQIPVNTSSVERLKSHPYINFYQAKAIVELRKKRGKIQNISELSLLEEFTETDLERIKYYLAF